VNLQGFQTFIENLTELLIDSY